MPQRRFFENVVQLPGVDIQSSARGRVLHHATREDGGGTLSLDLDDVYAAVVTDDDGRPIAAPYEAYGRVRRPHAFGDSGITGLRAMAVDYSGKSGADAMIVLVDRIDGHDKPLWAWQLESESEGIMQENIDTSGEGREVFKMENYEKARNGDLLLTESQPARDDRVRVHEDGFTYAQGDAAMRATFITPASPSLQLAERIQYHRTNIEVVRRDQSTGIFAEGDDGFFVILTFQDGPAPEVEVIEGSGLDATVRIGDQTVRFDGEKIILGE